MSIDFTGLRDLAKDPEKAKVGFSPLQPEDLGDGSILFFDQSLTATGWVKVRKVAGQVLVAASGVIPNDYSDAKNSIETQLCRGVTVFEHAVALLDSAKTEGYDVAHESPPNPAQVKGGGYGSLLAAQSVRNAAALIDIPIEMLGAQPGKKLVCGNGNAEKKVAHAALKETCFPWISGSEQITNEAKRDALIGALLWLHRRKS